MVPLASDSLVNGGSNWSVGRFGVRVGRKVGKSEAGNRIPFNLTLFKRFSCIILRDVPSINVLRRSRADVSTPTTERKTLDKRLISVYTGGRTLSATAFLWKEG